MNKERISETLIHYALLDEEGTPVRFFDYQTEGTVEVKEEVWKVDWNNYEECLL